MCCCKIARVMFRGLLHSFRTHIYVNVYIYIYMCVCEKHLLNRYRKSYLHCTLLPTKESVYARVLQTFKEMEHIKNMFLGPGVQIYVL
jgi:hypothetical protein